jgi:DNA-binding MarR family transcriptional regulator
MTAVLQPDPQLATPVRLTVVALLGAAAEVEFGTVRDAAQLSDSALSKLAAALEAVHYVRIRKGYVGKRPRTWLSLTDFGRVALNQHVAALNAIVASAPEILAEVRSTGTS